MLSFKVEFKKMVWNGVLVEISYFVVPNVSLIEN